MKPSDKCKKFIKSYENFKSKKYDANSPKGDWTIGYGHKLTANELNTGYIKVGNEKIYWENGLTESQAEKIFNNDVTKLSSAVDDAMKKHNIKLTQQQYDAAVSYAFNTGGSGLSKYKGKDVGRVEGLVLSMNDGAEATREWFMDFTEDKKIFKGIYKRRLDEYEIYKNGDYQKDSWLYLDKNDENYVPPKTPNEKKLQKEYEERYQKARAKW